MADSQADNLSYDQVAYVSYPYAFTQPDRLGALGSLLGMRPAPGDRCRVLEIGGASGGNLIALAERFPGSEFLGIDLSIRQTAEGRRVIEQLGLKNIRLEVGDILEIGPELGQFDYIVAHGVYSWVPPQVAEKLLSVCAARLTPQGIAYISYNVYPGWHFRAVVRDLLLYQSRQIADPVEKVRQGRKALDFLARFAPGGDSGYRTWIRNEEARLRNWEPSQILHDEMEVNNHPCYFHEFVDRAGRAGLKYLCDAQWFAIRTDKLAPEVAGPYRELAPTALEVEQYSDFLQNARFRRSMLCRPEVELSPAPLMPPALGLYVSSRAKPKEAVDPRPSAPVIFAGTNGAVTTDVVAKAIFLGLAEIWPGTVQLRELIRTARARIGPAMPPLDDEQCAAEFLHALPSAEIELWMHPPVFTTGISRRPLVSPFARLQAQSTAAVTSRRHETVRLDELTRQVAMRLDGSRDGPMLRDEMSELIASGSVIISGLAAAQMDRSRVHEVLQGAIEQSLSNLAKHALLIA